MAPLAPPGIQLPQPAALQPPFRGPTISVRVIAADLQQTHTTLGNLLRHGSASSARSWADLFVATPLPWADAVESDGTRRNRIRRVTGKGRRIRNHAVLQGMWSSHA